MKIPTEICASCVNFRVELAFACDTCGQDFEMYCFNRHWKLDPYKDKEEVLEKYMLMAGDCKEYVKRS